MNHRRSPRESRGGRLWTIAAPLMFLALLWQALWRRMRPKPEPKEPHAHLVPGQLNLVARHDSALSPERIAALVGQDPIFRDERLRGAFVRSDLVATFRRDGSAFSLVGVDVPTVRDERRLLRLINDLNRQLSDQQPPTNQSDNKQYWQPARGTAREAGEPPTEGANAESGRLMLQQATPNWLVGGAVERNGSGSPGGRPVPPDPGSLETKPGSPVEFWQFALPPELNLTTSLTDRGAGVDVFILDTAPDRLAMERAYRRWPEHPLIQSLLAPNGPLDVDYAGDTHLLQQADFYHDNANYVMSDHGLFVAGIIHAIAPQAKLHLVEVLNPYGVGTFLSIARGFAVAFEHVTAANKLIVNASLGFEVVPPDRKWLEYVRKNDPFWQELTPEEIKRLINPLEQICELFVDSGDQPGVGVVAAAGNDNTPAFHDRPPARYPAAFDDVLGVGALQHDNVTRTDYTNKADLPESSGAWVFGGDRVGLHADPIYGVLGVYIGAFPDGQPNTNGWARWAGTSFATPIITGALAALLGDGKSFADARAAVQSVQLAP